MSSITIEYGFYVLGVCICYIIGTKTIYVCTVSLSVFGMMYRMNLLGTNRELAMHVRMNMFLLAGNYVHLYTQFLKLKGYFYQ